MYDHKRIEGREAVYENGDVIKYKKNEKLPTPEWIFSPSLGWNLIPEDKIEEIERCNCMWDYFGKLIEDEDYAVPKTGWREHFFIMKSTGEWKFRIVPQINLRRLLEIICPERKEKEVFLVWRHEKLFI
jgi:hypothetical protein